MVELLNIKHVFALAVQMLNFYSVFLILAVPFDTEFEIDSFNLNPHRSYSKSTSSPSRSK